MNEIELFKPNELVATIGKLKLDRLARHLGNYFFEHAQKKIKFESFQGNTFRIDIKDLNSLAEIASKNYKEIEKSIKNLQQTVEIRSKDNKRFLSIVMFPEIGIDFNTAEYYFALSPTTIELLKNTDYFTKFELLEMNPLESKHSLIIYEWLKRYENAPQIPVMTVDELRQITDTSDKKAYDNFTNLKAKILDVATNEINTKTRYLCSYEAIKKRAKTRYKVTEIKWTFIKSQIVDIPVEQKLKHYEKYEDLFSSLKNTFIDLTIEDLYIADYRYTLDTLVLFAQQTEKYSAKNSKDFHQWLDDRTRMFKGYEYRENNIDNCYKALQYLTKKETENNISCTSENYLPMALLPPDLLKKEPDNEYVIEAKAQYGKFCYRDYIKYMYDLYEQNKDPGTQNLIEPFLLKENY